MAEPNLDLGAAYVAGITKPTVDQVGKFARVMVDAYGDPNFEYVDDAGGTVVTETTDNFTQPAVSSTVAVPFVSTAGMALNAVIYIETGGYYEVTALTDETHATIRNLGYPGNASPAATVTTGKKVTPGGVRGAQGDPGDPGDDGLPGLGINYRVPRLTVRVRATGNVNLASCPGTIDGVAMSAGHSFLADSQTNPAERDLYLHGGTGVAATRVLDFDGSKAVGLGLHVTVREGTANKRTTWYIDASNVTTAAPDIGLAWTDLDVEDFWITADGTDYAPAYCRCTRAFQLGLCFGTVWFQRQAEYGIGTPLPIVAGIEIRGRSSIGRGSGTFLRPILAGIVAFSSPIGTSGAGWMVKDLYILGYSSTAATDHHGIEASVSGEVENVVVQQVPGRGIMLRGKTSDDVGTLAATTSSGFTVPAAGGTVTVSFPDTTFLRPDTVIYIPTAGHYRVVSVVANTSAVLYNYGFATDYAYSTKNAPPGTIIATGKACAGVLSNVDKSRVNARVASTGLSGLYIDGDNANVIRIRIDVQSCGQRRVTDDHGNDFHGVYDNGYLGNFYEPGCHGASNTYHSAILTTTTATFVQPPTTASDIVITGKTVTITVGSTTGILAGALIVIPGAGWYSVINVASGTQLNCNLRRTWPAVAIGATIPTTGEVRFAACAFYSRNQNAKHSYQGCYTENSDVALVSKFSHVGPGYFGNLSRCNAHVGADGEIIQSATTYYNSGRYDSKRTLGNVDTDQIDFYSNITDTTGWKVVWDNATFTWQRTYGATLSWFETATGFTLRGGGFIGFSRGALFNGLRLQCLTIATIPGTSTGPDGWGIGDLIWVSDARGPWGYKVRDKVSNNLSWRPLQTWNDDEIALTDADATLTVAGGYMYGAASLTADRVKTLSTSGATTNSIVTITRRDTSAFKLTITNGGGGGGSFVMHGRVQEFMTFRFDGTNWILLASGRYDARAPLKAQNLAFSNALATVTAEAKTATLTGVAVGDNVVANPRETHPTFPDGVTFKARVSATNTVEIRVFNHTGGNVDLSGITWDIRAL